MSVSFIEPDLAALRIQPKAAVENTVGNVVDDEDEDLDGKSSPMSLEVPYFENGELQSIPRRISGSSCLSMGSASSSKRRKANGTFLRRVSFDTITPGSPPAPLSPTSLAPGGGNNESTDGSSVVGSHHISRTMTSTTHPTSFFRTPLFTSTSSSSNNKNPSPPLESLATTHGLTSYFVSSRHQDLRWTQNTRTFLFAYSPKEYSIIALEWLIQNLIQDGDELVCIKHHGANGNADDRRPAIYQKEAELLLERILDIIGPDLKINIIVELGMGKVKTVVNKSLLLYQPSIVVVGTNQKSFSNLSRVRYKKSVPSYLIAKSQVPVVMVTPWMAGQVEHPRKKSDDSSRGGTSDVVATANPTISRSASDSYEFNSNNPYLSWVAMMIENKAAKDDPELLSLTKVDTEYAETDDETEVVESIGSADKREKDPQPMLSDPSPSSISRAPSPHNVWLTISKSTPEPMKGSSLGAKESSSRSSAKWMTKFNWFKSSRPRQSS